MFIKRDEDEIKIRLHLKESFLDHSFTDYNEANLFFYGKGILELVKKSTKFDSELRITLQDLENEIIKF